MEGTRVLRVWVNDGLVDRTRAVVSVFDHGLTVGDGVFETLKVVSGVPFALTRHLIRLHQSAHGLGLPEPDLDRVRAAVSAVLAANEAELGELARLRITYTAGEAPLGSGRGEALPTLMVVAAPSQPWPSTTAAVTVPWPRNERGPLTGLKTTSYAENVIALEYAARQDAQESIFSNTIGNLCEGTGSNVFVAIDGRLVTPPLSAGPLAGVTRALVLEWIGADEVDLPMSALSEADEVFLTSSTRDVQPLHRLDDRLFGAAAGPISRKAMTGFATRSASELDP